MRTSEAVCCAVFGAFLHKTDCCNRTCQLKLCRTEAVGAHCTLELVTPVRPGAHPKADTSGAWQEKKQEASELFLWLRTCPFERQCRSKEARVQTSQDALSVAPVTIDAAAATPCSSLTLCFSSSARSPLARRRAVARTPRPHRPERNWTRMARL